MPECQYFRNWSTCQMYSEYKQDITYPVWPVLGSTRFVCLKMTRLRFECVCSCAAPSQRRLHHFAEMTAAIDVLFLQALQLHRSAHQHHCLSWSRQRTRRVERPKAFVGYAATEWSARPARQEAGSHSHILP